MQGMSYRDAVRAQRHGEHGTSAKDAMRALAGVSLIASGLFWGPVQWTLVGPTTFGETCIAISGTMFIVLGPPVLTAFLVPWSPGAMLLARLKIKTIGQSVIIACSLYLLYYTFMVLMSWWASRPVVAEAGMERMQSIIGIIAYILGPALLWAPVSGEEMQEELRQAQAVERYKIHTAADIAILRITLLRAQQKAAVGMANLIGAEREELATTLRALVTGIDNTIQEISGVLSDASGVAMELRGPLDDADLGQLLSTVSTELAHSRLLVAAPAPHADLALIPTPPRGAPSPAPSPQRVPVAHKHAITDDQERAYGVAREALGQRAWKRSDIEQVLTIEKTKALELIRVWRSAALVELVSDPKDHYVFIG